MSSPHSHPSLAGRTVLITGAGRGLGRAIALACLDAGATVIGVARSADELRKTGELAGQSAFHSVALDLSQEGAVDEITERACDAGPVFGVVHAAATQLRKPAVEVMVADWRRVHELNLEVPFLLSTSVARHQLQHGFAGSHVFIASLGASIGLPNIAPYNATKTGMLGVVRTLSTEWAASGIRVNALAPGYLHTALTADLLADEAQRSRIMSRIPMGRLGEPSEIGGPAVFLLSSASTYVTGTVLTVDGGWLAN